MPARPIDRVIEERGPALLEIPGVVGVAQGVENGVPVVRVWVASRGPEIERLVPADLEGHPVRLIESGPLKPR